MSKKFVDKVAASAVFDFIAYLSTRDNPITFSNKHDVRTAIIRMNEFLEQHNCIGDHVATNPEYWRDLHHARKNIKHKKKNKPRK